jgi:hypothetical protein
VYGGDIAPASDRAKPWPLCIEVKNAEGWSVEAFLQHNPGNLLLAHMLQCLSSSQLGCNKIPLLICKKNHQKALCFLYAHIPGLSPRGKNFLARLTWRHALAPALQKQYPWDGPIDFYVVHFEAFLVTFRREDFVV